jgi:hypothetical protein
LSGSTASQPFTFQCGDPTAPKKDCERARRKTGLEFEEVKRKYTLELFDSRFAMEKRRLEWVD